MPAESFPCEFNHPLPEDVIQCDLVQGLSPCSGTDLVDQARAVLSFADGGKPFDPLSKEDPDIGLPAEERADGGLGIYLVKKLMNEVRYEYRDGQNVLTIEKRF